MRFRDRPLLTHGIDRGLYLSRPALETALARPALAERNALLLGVPGAGKSTLLRWLAGHLEGQGRRVAHVNAALAGDAVSFLELVDGELGPSEHPPSPLTVAHPSAPGLLERARRLRRASATTVLVDNLLDSHVAFDVFGRLRDELWDTGHNWVVATRARDAGPLRTPPADAFWASAVEIPPLDQEEVTKLLALGLEPAELDALDGDRPVAGIFPRALIRDAETRLEDSPGSGVRAPSPHEYERRASELGRSEAMAMTELSGLGRPVSAHDPELLDRLGWTRPYAQRILSRLAAHDLVRSFPERSGTRTGRPRNLYEPNPHLP